MPKTYAAGADAKFIGAIEATAGVFPASGYRYLDLISTTLGADNPFSDRVLLGRGRNPGDPILASNEAVNGNIIIPASIRGMGFWLTALLGVPETTDTKATGWIALSALPAADSTVTFNGTTWTFKASGASGTQTNLGGDVDATLTQWATDLNASADAEVAKCTYTANTTLNRLEIERDLAGTAGNSYTLAVGTGSNATRSAATLLAGGYQHVWLSGGGTIPTVAFEAGFPELTVPYYKRYSRLSVNELQVSIEQEGTPDITLACLAGEETEAPLSLDSSPDTIADVYPIQRDAFITIDGAEIGGLMGGNLTFSNNMEPLYLVGGSRMVDATPTIVSCSGEAQVRMSSTADLRALARARTPSVQIYGWRTPANWLLQFRMPRAFFNIPREPIEGPGGIDTTYTWRTGADDGGSGAAMEATIINDIASYA